MTQWLALQAAKYAEAASSRSSDSAKGDSAAAASSSGAAAGPGSSGAPGGVLTGAELAGALKLRVHNFITDGALGALLHPVTHSKLLEKFPENQVGGLATVHTRGGCHEGPDCQASELFASDDPTMQH
jgi:hypothetical protein